MENSEDEFSYKEREKEGFPHSLCWRTSTFRAFVYTTWTEYWTGVYYNIYYLQSWAAILQLFFWHFRKCALRLTGFVLLSLAGVALFILLAMFIFVMHCITVSVSIGFASSLPLTYIFTSVFYTNLQRHYGPIKTVAPWVCLVPNENVSQALFNSLSSKNFLYQVFK